MPLAQKQDVLSWLGGGTAFMTVTYTQANAAGGAVVCEITPGKGNEFIIMQISAKNSGTNGSFAALYTAAGGTRIVPLGAVASGATAEMDLSVGTVQSTANATPSSASPTGIGYPVIVTGLQTLRIAQTGAGVQNDTFTVVCNVRLRSPKLPTVIHSNSTNPGNVTVTAGTEAFLVVE